MELTAGDTVATIDLLRGTLSLKHKRRHFLVAESRLCKKGQKKAYF